MTFDEFIIPDTVTEMDPSQFELEGIRSIKIVNKEGGTLFKKSLSLNMAYS